MLSQGTLRRYLNLSHENETSEEDELHNYLYFRIIFYHLVSDTLWLTAKQIFFQRNMAVLPLCYLQVKPLCDK